MHHETLPMASSALGEKRAPDSYTSGTCDLCRDSIVAAEMVGFGGFRPKRVDRRDLVFGWDGEFPRGGVDVAPSRRKRFNVTARVPSSS
jgi:hypothetical protein